MDDSLAIVINSVDLKSAKNSAEEGENTSRQNSAKSASAKSVSAKSASAKSASAKSASAKSASAKRKGKTPSIKVVVGSIDGKADENSNKMSLDVNVEVSGLTDDCEDVMFALMRDDKQIGDSMSSKHGGESEVKADLKFTLEGGSEDLCS